MTLKQELIKKDVIKEFDVCVALSVVLGVPHFAYIFIYRKFINPLTF